jgi:hypothetical protein
MSAGEFTVGAFFMPMPFLQLATAAELTTFHPENRSWNSHKEAQGTKRGTF